MVSRLNKQLPEPLNQLSLGAVRHRKFMTGEALFYQGDKSRGLFYVLSGVVELRRTSESGHEALMFRAPAGNTFAEASLFHNTYHCDAIATEPSEVIECSRSALLTQYRTDINFALSMGERFATQVQQSRVRQEVLSIKSAEERVYRAIDAGMHYGSARSLANEIGLSPEAVYRALSALSKCGRVQKNHDGLYATN